MMNYYLAPSILAADFNKLGEEIIATEKAGAKYLHFDVMDGMFVPSISFGAPILKAIKNTTKQVKDVHLMIEEPIRYVDAFKEAGADSITVHIEACKDLAATLKKIKESGLKTGVSIKPHTPVDDLIPYLDDLDMILIMSVEPGFGGQAFLPESLEKIRQTKQMIQDAQKEINIEVDGGIYLSNVKEVLEAGANIIVAGSAVFKGEAYENTKAFMEIIRDYE